LFFKMPGTIEAKSKGTEEEEPVNSIAMTATATPSTPNPKQSHPRQTAAEAIAANVQALIEQLEQGHSGALTAYLTAMGRFHNYSFGNILEIARQKPDATRVAGLYAWNRLGRKVRKGEHGIRILAPLIGVRRKKDEEAEKDITRQNEPVLVGFRHVYVFDVRQTEGAELPELSTQVTGSVGDYRERLVNFVLGQGITLEFSESIAPAFGVSYGGKIVMLPGQSAPEEFSTLVHELAHEMLHRAERRTATTKTVRETEAEAIAFVVGQTIGLDSGRASADYIHLYHGSASLLAESLEVIQRTSAVILSALETPQPEAATEAEPELAQAS
jgi:antirestriction protein ArdC